MSAAQSLQSSTFVKQLAANDLPTRKKAIKSLKAFISSRKDFPLFEYEKLWKGLFYAMWFSDKPRPQQYLARELGELFLDTPVAEYEKFVLAFWLIITREWSGIDHHRLDKFLLLVRRSLFYQIKKLKQEQYDSKILKSFLKDLAICPLSGDQKIPHGIPFHLMDIYCDELERVMFEDLENKGEEDELNDENEEEKKEIIENTPLKQFFESFVRLSTDASYKPIRTKIKRELFEDGRLTEWNINFGTKKAKIQKKQEESDSESESEDDENSEDDDEDEFEEAKENQDDEGESEDEWTGFE